MGGYEPNLRFASLFNSPTKLCVCIFAFINGWTFAFKTVSWKEALLKIKKLLLNYWCVAIPAFIIAGTVCLRGVYCLEQGIILIEDDITRAVGKETLQEGRSCEAVALEMGVTRRMIEYRKKNAEQKIADFAQKYGLVSRDV